MQWISDKKAWSKQMAQYNKLTGEARRKKEVAALKANSNRNENQEKRLQSLLGKRT